MRNRVAMAVVIAALVAMWGSSLIYCEMTKPSGGQEWQSQHVDGAEWANCVATGASGRAAVAYSHGGLFLTKDGGKTWTASNTGMKKCRVDSALFLSNNTVVAGSGRGIYRSTDGGAHWKLIPIKAPNLSVGSLACGSAGRIYAGDDAARVLVSEDGGLHWQMLQFPGKGGDICSMACDSNGNVFAYQESGGVWRSSDGGRNWQPAQTFGGDYCYGAVAVSAHGVVFADNLKCIMMSRDHGVNWKRVMLPEKHFKCRGISTSKTGAVFVITDNGCFEGDEDGDSWRPLNVHLRGLLITTAPSISGAKFADDGRLLAADYHGGIYQSRRRY